MNVVMLYIAMAVCIFTYVSIHVLVRKPRSRKERKAKPPKPRFRRNQSRQEQTVKRYHDYCIEQELARFAIDDPFALQAALSQIERQYYQDIAAIVGSPEPPEWERLD